MSHNYEHGNMAMVNQRPKNTRKKDFNTYENASDALRFFFFFLVNFLLYCALRQRLLKLARHTHRRAHPTYKRYSTAFYEYIKYAAATTVQQRSRHTYSCLYTTQYVEVSVDSTRHVGGGKTTPFCCKLLLLFVNNKWIKRHTLYFSFADTADTREPTHNTGSTDTHTHTHKDLQRNQNFLASSVKDMLVFLSFHRHMLSTRTYPMYISMVFIYISLGSFGLGVRV